MKAFKLAAAFLLLGEILSGFKVSATVTPRNVASPTRTSSAIAVSTLNIPYEICTESKAWVRPTSSQQKAKLQSLKRYSDEEIRELGGKYWKLNIQSVTHYPGGSGTYDIIHLSGLWTLRDDTHPTNCSSFSAIDSGKQASVWLLLHKVVSIKWQGNHYVMLVKPTGKGVQVIRFSRKEHQSSLPLTVMTEDGKRLEVLAR